MTQSSAWGQQGDNDCASCTRCERAAGALARKFGPSDNRLAAVDPLPAIFPAHTAPIIKRSADGECEFVLSSSQGRYQILEGQLRTAAVPGADDRLVRTR
jgi:hypothetical protein